jgi:hypothetical protein
VGPGQPGASPAELGRQKDTVGAVAVLPDGRVVTGGSGYSGGRVLVWDPGQPGRRTGRARPPRGQSAGDSGAAGRSRRHQRLLRPGAAAECTEQLTRHFDCMLRARSRYIPLVVWSSPLHWSRSGRTFMLGGTPGDTEHLRDPGKMRVTRCISRRERPRSRVNGALAGERLSRLRYGRYPDTVAPRGTARRTPSRGVGRQCRGNYVA